MSAKQIVLAARPKGLPDASTFRTETVEVKTPEAGEVRLKGLYYSVDPYMRGRMSDAKSYAAPYEVNQPIVGGMVGEVLESKADGIAKGDLVTGRVPWATEMTVPASELSKIDPTLAPPSHYLGILGMPGLTAYFGLMDIGKPKAGETVLVSGAAGAVGTVVGQLAKQAGCRVVGIAGSDEKVELLKNEFGFDEAINYKTTPDMTTAIATACPNGVDIYFDNVGGEITDAAIMNLNFHARIALCGQIAHYNATEVPMGPRLFPRLLTRKVLLKGFIVSDYLDRVQEGFAALAKGVKEGKLKYRETIVEGFDKLPEAFLSLFSGENKGKMIVKA